MKSVLERKRQSKKLQAIGKAGYVEIFISRNAANTMHHVQVWDTRLGRLLFSDMFGNGRLKAKSTNELEMSSTNNNYENSIKSTIIKLSKMHDLKKYGEINWEIKMENLTFTQLIVTKAETCIDEVVQKMVDERKLIANATS